MEETTRLCTRCGRILPLEKFIKNRVTKSGYSHPCKECHNKQTTKYFHEHPEIRRAKRHRDGFCRPMQEAKDSSQYLGVYVAESLISRYFEGAKRMPIGNPGYDFICKNGFKIDVKSSCLHKDKTWGFHTEKNEIADYFVFLAFDNRKDLNLMHFWIIPSKVVSHMAGISISSQKPLRFKEYEKPLDRLEHACDLIRSNGVDVNEIFVKSEI